MFIAIDGLDGCGKTTLLNSMKKDIQLKYRKSYDVMVISSSTEFKKHIHKYKLDIDKIKHNRVLLANTYLDVFTELMPLIIKRREDKVVTLLDRYVYSTLIYNTTNDQDEGNLAIIKRIEEIYMQSIPRLYYFMDIPPEECLNRIASRKVCEDPLSSNETLPFLQKVYNRHNEIANDNIIKKNLHYLPFSDIEALNTALVGFNSLTIDNG